MIRLPVQQQMYNVSGETIDYQRLDRTGFQTLAKLEHSGRIPRRSGCGASRTGFIARGGQIIDVHIVTTPIQHSRREENNAIAREEVSAHWNEVKRAHKDLQADWTNGY